MSTPKTQIFSADIMLVGFFIHAARGAPRTVLYRAWVRRFGAPMNDALNNVQSGVMCLPASKMIISLLCFW